MFPYINIEDLIQANTLLYFLNSRGRNLPEAFANTDFEATHIGFICGAIDRPFINCYTMLLHGQTTPQSYGQIIAWDDHEDAFDWMWNGQGIQPGEGLVILEIQRTVLGFLLKCCHLILGDMPPASLVSKDTPIQADPGPVLADSTAWSSLASLSKEAPYRVPASLDYHRLEAIIAAKHSAAKDHLWALREDPGYFAATVTNYSDHRVEMMLDSKGQRHPDYNTTRFWDNQLKKVVMAAYGSVFAWELLRKQVGHLKILERKYAATISPQRKLPTEYMDALLYLKFALDQILKQPIQDLQWMFPASPPLRSFSVRQLENPGRVTMASDPKKNELATRLLFVMRVLWDDHQLFLHGLSNVMDELGSTLGRDLKQKTLVSPLVAETISDLSVIAESLRQIKLYQPWAASTKFELIETERSDLTGKYVKALLPYEKLLRAMENIPLADLGMPLQGFSHYPIDRRKTRENIESMRKAEHRLDAFWGFLDGQVGCKNGDLSDFKSWFFGGDERKLYRTPEWVEPITEAEPKKLEAPYIPFAQTILNRENPIGPPTAKGKIKPKTRGTARPPLAVMEANNNQAIAVQVLSHPTIPVSKRAFKVFAVLFYTPSTQAKTPGEVLWPEFLHAMASVGFMVEKLHGSAWQFTPTTLDVEASIQFHEPHPEGKIPYVVARRHGRRLHRAYGWTGETFVRNQTEASQATECFKVGSALTSSGSGDGKDL